MFFFEMALAILFATLKEVIKNPEKKEALKKALVKLGHAIASAYPEEFE